MSAVRMYIAKFGREVIIEDDHPLAAAQRAANAADATTAKPAADMSSAELKTLAHLLVDHIDQELGARAVSIELAAGDTTQDESTQDGALGAALISDGVSGEISQDGDHPVEPPAPAASSVQTARRRSTRGIER